MKKKIELTLEQAREMLGKSRCAVGQNKLHTTDECMASKPHTKLSNLV